MWKPAADGWKSMTDGLVSRSVQVLMIDCKQIRGKASTLDNIDKGSVQEPFSLTASLLFH
jgi:hypothetical protein